MDNDDHIGFPHADRFQIPQFIYPVAPILALGGGAEVLPGGLHSQASWVGNNLISSQEYYTPENQYVFCLQKRTVTLSTS